MSEIRGLLAGLLWFMSLVAITHFVSTSAAVAVALITMIALLASQLEQHFVPPQ